MERCPKWVTLVGPVITEGLWSLVFLALRDLKPHLLDAASRGDEMLSAERGEIGVNVGVTGGLDCGDSVDFRGGVETS